MKNAGFGTDVHEFDLFTPWCRDSNWHEY